MKLQITYLKTNDLLPYAGNSRTHSDEQVNQIAASIKEFGFAAPICVAEGTILAGHGRVMAARKLGLEEVPTVDLSHLTPAQRRQYVVADNKLALNAGWDEEMLAAEIALMKEEGSGLDVLGFTSEELAEIQAETTEGETDPDKTPEAPVQPSSVLGDVWVMGKHRVMCGSSTEVSSVEKLMGGVKADMVFTDPPYNIGFGGTMSNTTRDGVMIPWVGANAKHDEIRNDRKTKQEFCDFITGVLSAIKSHCVGGYYICFSSSTLDELLTPLQQTGLGWKSIIIWNKNQSPMGGGHFRRKYEPIAYGYFENKFYGEAYSEDDVWDLDRTRKNDLHPTMKPVELVERAVKLSSKTGDVVLDLFGGSGTTAIACEQLGRSARLMELDPKYVDVIVTRWQNFTGKQATNEATGKTFDETKAKMEGAKK